ncbi:MAG: aldose 1-epimerase [Planctomycetes bacterium]|nr:aldose 1-epimerase [Planctomycetota bacterium]
MASQVVEITDGNSGSTARVLVSQGFNCFSWRPVLEAGPREMLWSEDGFERGDKRPSSGGNPILFPFPGRIGGAVFTFEGREYRLQPSDPFGNAIHGFVYTRPWRVAEQTGARVVGEFQASIDDPSILEHWPADFRLRVSYEVRGRELVSEIQYENAGDRRLPCGFGTHAYFRLPIAEEGSVADTVVTAPVHKYWELERMNPTGELLATRPDQPLADGLRLVDHQFDTVFTDVRSDADGRLRTRLTDPASGRVLTQTFDAAFTQCVIYTPGHRQAICLEPYTCVPDAIRLSAEGRETGLQVLAPGESFETTIRIDVK